jgi:hypothetical protein
MQSNKCCTFPDAGMLPTGALCTFVIHPLGLRQQFYFAVFRPPPQPPPNSKVRNLGEEMRAHSLPHFPFLEMG